MSLTPYFSQDTFSANFMNQSRRPTNSGHQDLPPGAQPPYEVFSGEDSEEMVRKSPPSSAKTRHPGANHRGMPRTYIFNLVVPGTQEGVPEVIVGEETCAPPAPKSCFNMLALSALCVVACF